MAIEIVDFPMKNGDFPLQTVSSPEGTSPFLYIRSVEGRRHHRRLERHLHLPPAMFKSTRESTSLSGQCLAYPSFSGLHRPRAMAFIGFIIDVLYCFMFIFPIENPSMDREKIPLFFLSWSIMVRLRKDPCAQPMTDPNGAGIDGVPWIPSTKNSLC